MELFQSIGHTADEKPPPEVVSSLRSRRLRVTDRRVHKFQPDAQAQFDWEISVFDAANWNAADAASQPLYGSPIEVESLIDAFKEDSICTAPLNQDGATPPTIHVPDTSTQDNLPPTRNTQACAVTVNSPENASSDDSAKSDAEARQDLSPKLADLVGGKDTRKRKAAAGGDDGEGKKHPVKRATHNIIERRYRTNLEEKIAALRDSVPRSRIISMNVREGAGADQCDELHRPVPAHKLSKAMVFSKATDYIHELEKSNRRLLDENNALKERIAALEYRLSELATTS
ncbi:transcriptional regulator family: Helix-loop-helix [Purpureocillium lilacinum]|uniref:Transcriptional regulator family: Helix-loop-helix n=1 Tax=Purpureocillium lilacinum TaxID=33203 RepID=A0ABR0BE21_PURLI|nr:transcriptional regulator family: Helix-loop-helix [Purpureocillium lilacinum]